MENFEDYIFYDEGTTTTTSSSTTKKKMVMDYERPPGWNKKPKKKWKLFEFFRIMYSKFAGDDLDDFEYRKYTLWMLDIKSTTITLGFTITLFYAISSFNIYEGYDPQNEEKSSLLDKTIEHFMHKEQQPEKVVVVKDSLVNIDSLAYLLQLSDSIIRARNARTDTMDYTNFQNQNYGTNH